MSDYDPVLHEFEREWQRRDERMRDWLVEQNRPDVLADYDAAIRAIRNGTALARSTWHSISPAQRTALIQAQKAPGGRLFYGRFSIRSYYPVDAGVRVGIPTMRNLCERELMAWDGGAFEPESAVVLTERGRFVLKHGPVE